MLNASLALLKIDKQQKQACSRTSLIEDFESHRILLLEVCNSIRQRHRIFQKLSVVRHKNAHDWYHSFQLTWWIHGAKLAPPVAHASQAHSIWLDHRSLLDVVRLLGPGTLLLPCNCSARSFLLCSNQTTISLLFKSKARKDLRRRPDDPVHELRQHVEPSSVGSVYSTRKFRGGRNLLCLLLFCVWGTRCCLLFLHKWGPALPALVASARETIAYPEVSMTACWSCRLSLVWCDDHRLLVWVPTAYIPAFTQAYIQEPAPSQFTQCKDQKKLSARPLHPWAIGCWRLAKALKCCLQWYHHPRKIMTLLLLQLGQSPTAAEQHTWVGITGLHWKELSLPSWTQVAFVKHTWEALNAISHTSFLRSPAAWCHFRPACIGFDLIWRPNGQGEAYSWVAACWIAHFLGSDVHCLDCAWLVQATELLWQWHVSPSDGGEFH